MPFALRPNGDADLMKSAHADERAPTLPFVILELLIHDQNPVALEQAQFSLVDDRCLLLSRIAGTEDSPEFPARLSANASSGRIAGVRIV